MKPNAQHDCVPVVLFVIAITFSIALAPAEIKAQGLPPILRGDFGLKSGSQAPPGIYVTNLIYHYNPNTLVTSDGREIETRTRLNQGIYAFVATYVSNKKILGGHYSATWVLPLANIAIEGPILDSRTGWSASDMYFQPIQLGWHLKQADVVAGYGIYVPTGRFTAGANNNTGLGMWSHELSLGTTLYLNEKKSFHLATLATYNINSEKRGTNQKVGDTLSLEGGVGVALMKGYANVGAAYYTQWKMTRDENYNFPPGFSGKHRYIGIGPEFNTVLPISKTTPFFATFRYLFETGNRTATQGNVLFFGVTIAFPTVR